MLEQDFEKLLASFLDDELDEAGLESLAKTVKEIPAHRRRFQRELRIHTLMRESAMVLLNTKSTEPPGKIMFLDWKQRAVGIAAVLVLFASLMVFLTKFHGGPQKIGTCLHVKDGGEIQLLRNGKAIEIVQGATLREGDRLLTAGDAEASFHLENIGNVTVSHQSEVLLAGPSARAAVEIKRGQFLLEAAHREEGSAALIIRTPKAEVEVMGTVFGMEVDPVATRVSVHEGRVRYRETITDQAVEVEEGQYCVNDGKTLKALSLSSLQADTLMPGRVRLTPVADVYVEANRIMHGANIRVESGRRVSHLRFEVPDVGRIAGATLRLKQMIDPGSGRLRLSQGSSEIWSEQSTAASELPKPLKLIFERKGWVRLNQEIEFDLSSLILTPGSYNLILTLAGSESNDVWFGSRESMSPPELILFVEPENS